MARTAAAENRFSFKDMRWSPELIRENNDRTESRVQRCRRTVAGSRRAPRLENVPAQIGVLRDARELLADELGVDGERLPATIFGLEADILEQLFHHRLQAARADILDGFVDLGGDAGECLDAVVGELNRDALGAQ